MLIEGIVRDRAERCGDRDMELLVPWLEIEALRDLAEDSSCDNDCDCESDLCNVTKISAYLN
jgi:hypothetical protein